MQQSSETLQDVTHRLGYLPPSPQVVAFLLPLHPPRSQHHEDRILVQEVVDQDTAYFIVKPLFLFRPVLALGFIELSHDFETFFVGIVTQSVFEKRLVEIEPPDSVLPRVLVLQEELSGYVSRLVLLLHKAEYLIDLVGNHISVLIYLIFGNICSGSVMVRVVLLVSLQFPSFRITSFHLWYFVFVWTGHILNFNLLT